jgi:hypothetical protein
MRFLDAIKALFPFSKAFRLVIDNNHRKLVKSLSFLPEKIRTEAEKVYMDLFPYTTRAVVKWSKAFAIIFGGKELKKQRDILQANWRIHLKGQSASFMEYILQHLDPKIKVIENVPVSNPRQSNIGMSAVNGNEQMVNGGQFAINNYHLGDDNFIPYVINNDLSEFYTIPNNPEWWDTCFFICGGVIRNDYNEILYAYQIQMSKVWKNYLEYLVLKMKPLHSTAIIFIDWTEGDE